jgi:hypothetical protein
MLPAHMRNSARGILLSNYNGDCVYHNAVVIVDPNKYVLKGDDRGGSGHHSTLDLGSSRSCSCPIQPYLGLVPLRRHMYSLFLSSSAFSIMEELCINIVRVALLWKLDNNREASSCRFDPSTIPLTKLSAGV